MKIPLEDNYADILSKARRGLGLDVGTLSTRAGLLGGPDQSNPRRIV